MTRVDKVAIIGLPGLESGLVFDRWADDLPNLRHLTTTGLTGMLESCLPPSPIPLWSCLTASKDPGTLGFYGARSSRDWSYEELGRVTNLEMRHPRIWDHVARANHRFICIGVPQTFPMVHSPRGTMITGSLTPGVNSPFTQPPGLAGDIAQRIGQYRFDASVHPDEPDTPWLPGVYEMDKQRFNLARHLVTAQPWELMLVVAPGLERAQQGLWAAMDTCHRRHRGDDPLADALHDYYVFVDAQLGELLDGLDPDTTAIVTLSPYGAQPREGSFRINNWLATEGLLTLRETQEEPIEFNLQQIDWDNTKAWAVGGASANLWINHAERDPRGVVPPEQYESFREELIERLLGVTLPDGRPLKVHAYRPEELFAELNGVPPDLIVEVDELRWHCDETVGGETVCPPDNGSIQTCPTTGGMYTLTHPDLPCTRHDGSIFDILPTVLELLGTPIPRGLRGESLLAGTV